MASTTSITPARIARLRMQTLGLVRPAAGLAQLETPLEVVRWQLATQSQEWGASRWAIGSRLPASARDVDVIAAYDGGEIVRSWPQRGTVHAVAARDLRWMLDLTGVRALTGLERRWQALGIDEAFLERARELAVQLLQGGRSCSRQELRDALVDGGLDMSLGQRSYHVVWYLAQTGTLVLGPTRDGEQLLVLLDEWIEDPLVLDRGAALRELGRRYLRSHGPASIEDLAWWTRLSRSDCRQAIDANADELVELLCGERTLWMLREQHEQLDPDLPAAARGVHALASFDEHLLGYRVRDDVLHPDHASAVDPARNGVFRSTLTRGGVTVATWSRARLAHSVRIDVTPLKPLPARLRGPATRAFERWAGFFGTRADVRWPG